MSWGLCSYFGTGIPQSRQGDWINHVIDVSDITSTNKPDLEHIIKRSQLRTNHAGGELDFHTDTTDIFVLFSLRKAKAGGASRLVSSAMLHNLILTQNPDYLKALYAGHYYMSQSLDHESGAPRVSSQRVPVFTRKGNTVQGYYISQVVQRAIDLGKVRYSAIEDAARERLQHAAKAPGIALCFVDQRKHRREDQMLDMAQIMGHADQRYDFEVAGINNRRGAHVGTFREGMETGLYTSDITQAGCLMQSKMA